MRNFARFLIDSLGQVFSASNFAKLSGGKHLASESRSSSLAFNATNGEITLTGADGSSSTVNLPIELLLQSANYNSTTKNLTLTTNGGATVVVPLSDLVDLPEIVIAAQNPSAPPSTGQKVYFRSDTGGIWLNVSNSWQGPIASSNQASSAWNVTVMDGPGSPPPSATIILADIPLASDSGDCQGLFASGNFTSQLECETINNACAWVDPAYQCNSANGTTQGQCEAVAGCQWQQMYCEDITDGMDCESKSECVWDSENNSCSGGLYSNECNGEPTQTGCIGTFGSALPIPQINFPSEDQFQAKTIVVANRHGFDNLLLQLDGEGYFATIPSGKAILITFNDGTFERVVEWT